MVYPERTLVQKYVITPQMVGRKRKRRIAGNAMGNETVAAILNAYIQADGKTINMIPPLGVARTACLDAIQRWGPKLLPAELKETVLARRHGKRRPVLIAAPDDHHDLAGRVMALEQRMATLQNGVHQTRAWPTGKMFRRAIVRRTRFLFTGR